MRRVLVDVNVVLDVLLARAPHAAASTACMAAIVAIWEAPAATSVAAPTAMIWSALMRRPSGRVSGG